MLGTFGSVPSPGRVPSVQWPAFESLPGRPLMWLVVVIAALDIVIAGMMLDFYTRFDGDPRVLGEATEPIFWPSIAASLVGIVAFCLWLGISLRNVVQMEPNLQSRIWATPWSAAFMCLIPIYGLFVMLSNCAFLCATSDPNSDEAPFEVGIVPVFVVGPSFIYLVLAAAGFLLKFFLPSNPDSVFFGTGESMEAIGRLMWVELSKALVGIFGAGARIAFAISITRRQETRLKGILARARAAATGG